MLIPRSALVSRNGFIDSGLSPVIEWKSASTRVLADWRGLQPGMPRSSRMMSRPCDAMRWVLDSIADNLSKLGGADPRGLNWSLAGYRTWPASRGARSETGPMAGFCFGGRRSRFREFKCSTYGPGIVTAHSPAGYRRWLRLFHRRFSFEPAGGARGIPAAIAQRHPDIELNVQPKLAQEEMWPQSIVDPSRLWLKPRGWPAGHSGG